MDHNLEHGMILTLEYMAVRPYISGLCTSLTGQLQLQKPAIYKNSISKMFQEFEALAISKSQILHLNMTSWLGPI